MGPLRALLRNYYASSYYPDLAFVFAFENDLLNFVFEHLKPAQSTTLCCSNTQHQTLNILLLFEMIPEAKFAEILVAMREIVGELILSAFQSGTTSDQRSKRTYPASSFYWTL